MLVHDSRCTRPIAERLHQLNEFVFLHSGYGRNGTFAPAFGSMATATGTCPIAPKRILGPCIGTNRRA